MSARRIVAALVASAALVCVSTASAKDFGPGDLRVCDAKRCVPLVERGVLKTLAAFYYGSAQPKVARPPRMAAPAFELRFRNGYVTGIVASARLDRFLSYGVYLGRFRRGTWYRAPANAARELERLAASLEPLHVTRAALLRSR
jgi:hypothetical protein